GVNTFGTNSLLISTTTIATAEAQLFGFNTSQIVYGYSYVPGLVDGAIVIVPSGFIVRPGSLGIPGVNLTLSKSTGPLLKLSFSNTLGVEPISLFHSIRSGSLSASINVGSTTTVTVVWLQLAGFNTSQMR